MVFSSSIFLFAFLPAVLLVYYLPLRRWRLGQNVFLLLASLFFYGWGAHEALWLMVASILANYLLGLWAGHARTAGRSVRPAVAVAVVVNLSLLFVFKYLDFTISTLNMLGWELPLFGIELPIGISFFTFQAMSYVFDVARGKASAQKNPMNVGLYVALFPQLVAGPIVKYETVAHDIQHRKENWADFSDGTRRFLIGLGKKVLLSNQLAVVADASFGAAAPTASLAWLGLVCYTLQLYYDFSGYSDMAIGLGKMFGFHFEENFRWPYAARSFIDLWRRWHISLTDWFRDYLYIPLGGSRVSQAKQLRNLLIVWSLTGIWHGAEWTFLCWGLFSFLFIVLEKYCHLGRGWPAPCQHILTLLIFVFSLVFFRADDLPASMGYFAALFGANGGWEALTGFYFRENLVFLIAGALFAVPFAPWLRARAEKSRLAPVWSVGLSVGLLALLVVCSSFLIKQTYNPFIYFQF